MRGSRGPGRRARPAFALALCPRVNAATQKEEEGGGQRRRREEKERELPGGGSHRGEAPSGGGTPRGMELQRLAQGVNSQGGGTPRGWKSQGGGTPRGQEGGTPRGWNPQEGISVCWALEDTSANSHEGIYIYIANLLLFIQCKEISASAQICTEGKGFCLKCEAYFWHRS